MKFAEAAVMLLRQWCGLSPLLQAVFDLYRTPLQRSNEAIAYLDQRGIHSSELIEHMRIGYAPGSCLRSWLTQLGYPLSVLRQAGLITTAGYDSYIRRIVFPLENNLYGRSIRTSASPHCFLPGSKGGLYLWEDVRRCPELILVEGLFDYAVLWQAGFRNVTCSLGNHLNARQFQQLCDGSRTVYRAFDADANGSGSRAAQSLSRRLWAEGISVRRVVLLDGHDPNSFFCRGRRCRRVPQAAGGGSPMKFGVIEWQTSRNAQSPARVIEQTAGREVGSINRYPDREYVRRVGEKTLRIYAYNLLQFVRWWDSIHHTDALRAQDLTESILLDYLRFLSNKHPRPAGSTTNACIAVADRDGRDSGTGRGAQAIHQGAAGAGGGS